ncbi:hypothetical protein [Gordonia alkaliphila]
MDEGLWREHLKAYRRRMLWAPLGLSALGCAFIAVSAYDTDWEFSFLGFATGALLLVVALTPVTVRLLPIGQPRVERTETTLSLVASPRGRVAIITIPIAVAMAVAAFAALTLDHWRKPLIGIVGIPLAIVLALVSFAESRYEVTDRCFAHVVDYGGLVWVREVDRPTIAWLDSRLILYLAGDVTVTRRTRGSSTSRSKEGSVLFRLSPLPDRLATEFAAEVVRRTGIEISYGVMPTEMWDMR